MEECLDCQLIMPENGEETWATETDEERDAQLKQMSWEERGTTRADLVLTDCRDSQSEMGQAAKWVLGGMTDPSGKCWGDSNKPLFVCSHYSKRFVLSYSAQIPICSVQRSPLVWFLIQLRPAHVWCLVEDKIRTMTIIHVRELKS